VTGPDARAIFLADEQFGASILQDATGRGYMTALSAEWSGGDDFHLEYGEDYASHIE
jgi:hypothetical protein